jgi:hypothetical protein
MWVIKQLPQYSVSKKSKTYRFQDEWEIEYFFLTVKNKCFCLICISSVSLPRKGLESHYNAFHSNKYKADFPPKSEIRKLKLKVLKLKSAAQQQLWQNQGHVLTIQQYHSSRSLM